MALPKTDLDALTHAIKQSTKYRNICEDVICNVGERELTKRKTLREAIAETKNTLHQIGGAYFNGKLPDVPVNTLLAHHASTRERLPIAARFFLDIFSFVPGPKSLLDVACGLNPLLIEQMPIERDCEYVACDIYQDLVTAVNTHFQSLAQRGGAFACDVSEPQKRAAAGVFSRQYDVAFLFKCLTCLEPIDRAAPHRLLDGIKARHLVISYPIASLGGHNRNMPAHYRDRFQSIAAARSWSYVELVFATELVFIVTPQT